MSEGQCLCGSIRWSIINQPVAAYHCHCSMCRKAHGSAFATYYQVAVEDFKWQSDPGTIRRYRSSPEHKRAFCSTCGSVVANHCETGGYALVPAGPHDDGPAVQAHIFTASKASWYQITDTLPQYEFCAPDQDYKVDAARALSAPVPGVVRGSCLCDSVQFIVTEPFRVVHNCHCSRCRRARAAAFATNGFTSIHGIEFVSGEPDIYRFKLPEAAFFTQAFCNSCGGAVPRKDPDRAIAVIPMGSLDDEPGTGAADHIFTGNKAKWYTITDELPVFAGMPE